MLKYHSVCPHDCPSACALEIEKTTQGMLGKVKGSHLNSYTNGVICSKVSRYSERLYHPERLKQPLKRVGEKGEGRFEPISWNDALDEIAQAFVKKEQAFGSETIWPYWYAGTMGFVQRDGIERLTFSKKYSRYWSTICTRTNKTGWLAGYGKRLGVPAMEAADHSKLIIVWGCNPVATHVNMMSHIAKARKRGARLLVIDPYQTGTAAIADWHIALNPGSDGALACAIIHILLRDQLADRAYIEKTANTPLKEIEDHFRDKTPEWASPVTGVSVEDITKLAHEYGQSKQSWIRIGYGFTRSRNGTANMHAVSTLPIISGAWQHQGGGAHYNVGDSVKLDTSFISGTDLRDTSIRILDQSRIGPVLTGDPRDLAGGPPVTGMIIQSTNPAAIAPELYKVHEGFKRPDLFLAVHEQFMTDTARFADIVLPATMFLEHDDFYAASAHSMIHIGPKIFEPPAECRSNHEVISALAKRLGLDHPAFFMSAMELVNDSLKRSGYPNAQIILDQGGYETSDCYEDSHFLNGFPTADGKFQIKVDWSKFGPHHEIMPPMPDHLDNIDESNKDHPFRLVAAPARQFLNSSFTELESSRKREVGPRALIHPDIMMDLGIKEGDIVELGNKLGAILVKAAKGKHQKPKTVVVESVWPNDYWIGKIGINALISAEPAPPAGGAAIHDTAIWLKKSSKNAVHQA